MKKTKQLVILIALLAMADCSDVKNKFDASGSFESEEVIISSEATGNIKQFAIDEGQVLTAGQAIGYVDSTQLYWRKKQLLAQIQAGLSQIPDIPVQLAIAEEQLKVSEKEKLRFTNLVTAGAATQKQLDDLVAQIEVQKKQIQAQRSSLGITSGSIREQTLPLEAQIGQINDQLLKCRIVNPLRGTVLVKYAETNEMAVLGKPLYKIADLSTLILRAYITAAQLSRIKLGQPVSVLVDKNDDGYKTYGGIITWVSDKAEFTPKTIQTKEERANTVYAVKIKVKNDGFLKLGMYAEVKF